MPDPVAPRPAPRHTHRRIIQLMPATGWWTVYADAGGWFRERIPAFALVEEWESTIFNATMARRGADVERYVYPLTIDGRFIEINEDDNIIWLVHDDEWKTETADHLAADYAAKRVRP